MHVVCSVHDVYGAEHVQCVTAACVISTSIFHTYPHPGLRCLLVIGNYTAYTVKYLYIHEHFVARLPYLTEPIP